MEAKLVVAHGHATKSEVKLKKLPTVVGRGRDSDLTVAHPTVSRRHCQISELDGALVVKDLGSLNGILVDNVPVKEAVLKPGSLLTVGPLTFRAVYEHPGEFPTLGDAGPETIVAMQGTETIEELPAAPPRDAARAAGTSQAVDDDIDFFDDLADDLAGPAAAAPQRELAEADLQQQGPSAGVMSGLRVDEAHEPRPSGDAMDDLDLDWLSEKEPAEAAGAAAVESLDEPGLDDLAAAAVEEEPLAVTEPTGADVTSEPDFGFLATEPESAGPASEPAGIDEHVEQGAAVTWPEADVEPGRATAGEPEFGFLAAEGEAKAGLADQELEIAPPPLQEEVDVAPPPFEQEVEQAVPPTMLQAAPTGQVTARPPEFPELVVEAGQEVEAAGEPDFDFPAEDSSAAVDPASMAETAVEEEPFVLAGGEQGPLAASDMAPGGTTAEQPFDFLAEDAGAAVDQAPVAEAAIEEEPLLEVEIEEALSAQAPTEDESLAETAPEGVPLASQPTDAELITAEEAAAAWPASDMAPGGATVEEPEFDFLAEDAGAVAEQAPMAEAVVEEEPLLGAGEAPAASKPADVAMPPELPSFPTETSGAAAPPELPAMDFTAPQVKPAPTSRPASPEKKKFRWWPFGGGKQTAGPASSKPAAAGGAFEPTFDAAAMGEPLLETRPGEEIVLGGLPHQRSELTAPAAGGDETLQFEVIDEAEPAGPVGVSPEMAAPDAPMFELVEDQPAADQGQMAVESEALDEEPAWTPSELADQPGGTRAPVTEPTSGQTDQVEQITETAGQALDETLVADAADDDAFGFLKGSADNGAVVAESDQARAVPSNEDDGKGEGEGEELDEFFRNLGLK